MAVSQNPRFCVFCYRYSSSVITAASKENLNADGQPVTIKDNFNAERVKTFVKLIDRFVGSGTTNSMSIMNANMALLDNSDLLKSMDCCGVCGVTVDSFCKVYHEFKCLELQLDWELDKLERKIRFGSRVPSRLAKVNNILKENSERNRMGTSLTNKRIIIRDFRHTILKLCRQSKAKSTPRVLLERDGYLPQLKSEHWSSKNVPIIINTVSCGMPSSAPSLTIPLDDKKLILTRVNSPPPGTEVDFDSLNDHINYDDDELNSIAHEDTDQNPPEPVIETKLDIHSNIFGNIIAQGQATEEYSRDNTKNVKIELPSRTPSKTKIFYCTVCNKHFKYEGSLKTHMKKIHSSPKPHHKIIISSEDTKCTQASNQECWETTTAHKPQRYKFRKIQRQTYCDEVKNDPSDDDSSDEESSFDNEPLSNSDLDYNKNDEGDKAKKLQKKKRGESKKIADSLLNYSNLINSDGIFKCDFCETVKDNAPDLAIHEMEHAPDNDTSSKKKSCCPRCAYTYTQTMSYVKHHLKNHLGLLGADCATACTMCSGGRFYVKNTPDHFQKVHNTNGLDSSEIQKCDICSAYFIKAFQLQRHKHQIHQQGHKCTECDKTFTNRKAMYAHVRNIHKFDEDDSKCPFPCDIAECNHRFATQGELAHHKIWSHRGGPDKKKNSKYENNTCKQCGKVFGNLLRLYAHVNKVHAARTHVCSECGKAFKTRPVLETHMEYHKGQAAWKFQCTTCGKMCFDKYKLISHMRTHTKIKSWICQFCGESYAHRHNWKAHTLSKHGDKDGVNELVNVHKPQSGNFLSRKGSKKGDSILASK